MAPKNESTAMVPQTSGQDKSGPFCRRPTDRRLVKQVLGPHVSPTHWLPMDLATTECKLMEVRKYSAEYNNIDTKFRKPHLELITAFAVQNPFLYGCYDLRKEQMKMQAKTLPDCSVKEKYFYFPTTFDNLESIIRNNFLTADNIDDDQQYHSQCKHHSKFYSSSVLANEAFKGVGNPRVMLVARVTIGVCHLKPEFTSGASNSPPPCPFERFKSHKRGTGLAVDTLTNEQKTVFYKFNINEMYPDHILIYRDLDGPHDDRTTRLKKDIKHCFISYRAGTRYNPDEQEYKGLDHRAEQAALAAAAIEASKSAVGYYNAQTDIKVEKESGKKSRKESSSLSMRRIQDDSEDSEGERKDKKKKKFSFISLLSFKTSGDDADRKSKKSFNDKFEEETEDMKENIDMANITVESEAPVKVTGAIPKKSFLEP